MEAKTKQPKIKRPPVLFKETQRLLTRIEKALGMPVLAYWNSPNGSVCQSDVEAFNEIFRVVGRHKRVALFIKSDGGTGRASLRIVHLMRHFAGHVTAVIPLNCCSAATMLALGADEIRMGAMAFLSAVDTSITHELSPVDKNNNLVSVSQDELSRIIRLWRGERRTGDANPYQALFNHVHPLAIGAVDRASSLSIKLCVEILSYHMKDKRKAEAISTHLNASYPSHSYPITLKEAQRIGLNVRPLDPAINALLIELNERYAEMGQRAVTDFDDANHHDHEILNITEGRGLMLYYQQDKDWHYRKEERRWVSLNDRSSWRKVTFERGRMKDAVYHIR